jgi:hypothetical protein
VCVCVCVCVCERERERERGRLDDWMDDFCSFFICRKFRINQNDFGSAEFQFLQSAVSTVTWRAKFWNNERSFLNFKIPPH